MKPEAISATCPGPTAPTTAPTTQAVPSRRRALAALGGLAWAAAGLARAQGAWPARPVKIVVPFAAGGLTDTLCRSVAELMTPTLGQQVVVENRPGAAGHIAAEFVARSAPDGYTIGMLGAGHAGGAAYSLEPIRYDLLRDFANLGMLGFSPSLIIVRKSLGVKNFPELVALARARPGEVSFAGVQSYTGEYMETMAGINLNLILYKGASQATTDMLAERVDMMLGTVSDMMQLMHSGKFNAIALNSPQRLRELPDVAPVAEVIPGYRGGQWYGLFAPAATPEPVLTRLRAELARVVALPAYAAALTKLSMLPPDMNLQQFSAEVAGTLASFQRARQLGRPVLTR